MKDRKKWCAFLALKRRRNVPPLVVRVCFIMVEIWQILQVSMFLAKEVVSKCSKKMFFPKCWKTLLYYGEESSSAWKRLTISHVKRKNFLKPFNTILYQSNLDALFPSDFEWKKKDANNYSKCKRQNILLTFRRWF